MIDFVKNNDHICLICGRHVDTVDMKINRANGENVIRFAICEACISVMREELGEGWIPVSDRLPEEGQEVLAYIKHNYADDDFRAYRVYEYDARFIGMGNLCEVIAWKPLPKPYREADR